MSPSGVDAFRRKKQAKEDQKQQFESNSGVYAITNDFRLQSNQYAIVRFLEQGDDLTFADVHRLPVQGKTKSYFKNFVCLDVDDDGTPCPACQSANRDYSKRTTRGFLNIIWRDGPVFQRDENKRMVKDAAGKYIMVGREDQIALWNPSWTVFETLKEKDSKFKGLMSRDWEVKRTGSTMNDTVWHIEPKDPDGGATPMLIPDLTLVNSKYDLSVLTRPMSYQDLAQILNRGATPTGPQPTMDRSSVMPTADSTFSQGAGEPQRASAFSRG